MRLRVATLMGALLFVEMVTDYEVCGLAVLFSAHRNLLFVNCFKKAHPCLHLQTAAEVFSHLLPPRIRQACTLSDLRAIDRQKPGGRLGSFLRRRRTGTTQELPLAFGASGR